MKYYDGIEQLIGRTPLIRIRKLNQNSDVMILAKLEKMNPGGSVKDRVALSMLEDAERKGLLTPDTIIIEPTSGNTGIGLAMLCASKGYNCEFVMAESMSIERRKIIMAYGARVILTPAEEGVDGPRKYVKRRLDEEPEKYFSPNQYDNPANWGAHYSTTAQEILDDTDSQVTHFIGGLGTSGTLMGVARRLKEQLDTVEIIAVEPDDESFIQGLRNLERNDTPSIFDPSLINRRIRVSGFQAERTARRLSNEEGLFVGKSSGAAMWGALQIARGLHEEGVSGTVLVVVLPDSGERYLSGVSFASALRASSRQMTEEEAVT
ncbi:MAG: PLP-dependent cysteine synthase family protein [Candidatus Thorarchaeota archaeon]